MRAALPIFALAGLLAAPIGGAIAAKPDPEAQIAKLTAGYTAQAPTSCITPFASNSSTVIDKTAILYRNGGMLYLNRFDGQCPQLTNDTMIVTKSSTGQLCRGDIVEINTRPSPVMPLGACAFGDFVPYKRDKK